MKTMITKSSKLTPSQVEESVRGLVKLILTGNGQPSLLEMVRKQSEDVQSLKAEILPRLETIEGDLQKRNSEASVREIAHWKEKFDVLELSNKTKKETNTYWLRVVVGLVLAQLVQFVFLWIVSSS